MKLFETFIICGDRAIQNNQKIILDEFFKNPDVEDCNFITFRTQYKPEAND